jgi:hypothetical protein
VKSYGDVEVHLHSNLAQNTGQCTASRSGGKSLLPLPEIEETSMDYLVRSLLTGHSGLHNNIKMDIKEYDMVRLRFCKILLFYLFNHSTGQRLS